jgi:hypothetical protein
VKGEGIVNTAALGQMSSDANMEGIEEEEDDEDDDMEEVS